jgi:hypothetical protein
MFTLDEIHVILLNILFLNAMSLHNACATISGLFNDALANEWIVTPKFGCKSKGICLATKSIEKDLLTLKRNKNVIITSHEKNINQCHPYRLLFGTRSIDGHFQWIYRRIRQIFRPYHFYKAEFLMAVYLLVISYLAFEKQKYFTGIYMLSNSMMYFILAFGCMGRQIEQLKKRL